MALELTIPGGTSPTFQSGEWRFSSAGQAHVRLALPEGVRPVAKELVELPAGTNFRPLRLVINLALVQAADASVPVTQAHFTLRIRVKATDLSAQPSRDRLALAYYKDGAWTLLNPVPDTSDANYLLLELESWPDDPAIGIGSK